MLKKLHLTRDRFTVLLLLASACLTTAAIADGMPQSGVDVGKDCCPYVGNSTALAVCQVSGCNFIHPVAGDPGFSLCLGKAIAYACPAQAN